jgi:hypothetical protein
MDFVLGNKWKKFVAKKTNKGETNPAGAAPHSQTKLHFLGIWARSLLHSPIISTTKGMVWAPCLLEILEDQVLHRL